MFLFRDGHSSLLPSAQHPHPSPRSGMEMSRTIRKTEQQLQAGTQVQMLASPLTRCVTSGKLLDLSEFPYPRLVDRLIIMAPNA